MKATPENVLFKPFRRLALLFKNHPPARAADESPLRAELFSTYQMERHGRALAKTHKISAVQAPDRLLSRLADNERVIAETCALLIEAVKSGRQITPAAEWLLDNLYLIEEQIRTAKRHLPKGYSRGLPRLQDSSSGVLPRVYAIALEIISHGDGRVDPENLAGFMTAYQQVAPLKIGEIWAVPIMLRLALIENLRRVATRLSTGEVNGDLAGFWADKMMETADKDPSSLIMVIADMARSNPPMESSFVAELTRRLQGQGPALALPLTWIEQRLSQQGLTIEQMVHSEVQQQASDQVSISHSISSLRFLTTTNWRNFAESMSVVEQTLHTDPAGVYPKMDFATRDRYRHSIEKIAKNADIEENEVALHAIELAKNHADDPRRRHVGFYLIGKGLPRLEQVAKAHLSFPESIKRAATIIPLPLYLGAIALLTGGITWALVQKASAEGLAGWMLACAGLVFLTGASHLAVSLVNWLATMFAKPHPVPRMDFSKGIPPDSRTLVTVPTMLTSLRGIDDLVEALEVRFLANRCDNLHFCLLTDFADAPSETMPMDESLVIYAREKIDALNEKYAQASDHLFFLFHRPRRWNDQEKVWMGYERKRGKLGDLNAFLRSGSTEAFSCVTGRVSALVNVRYVITLDTDTQLPRDTAWQFVGAMAHPANRPHFDERLQRISDGYGILQPRVAASLPGTNASMYARLSGGEPGIDPYTRAVSDVYQDIFQEGSFIGKGIYDVDAFEHALRDRFPENRILSHDLLEGCYARSGLLSDVQLYEEYPSSYSADVSRRHRWIRGDWQLASWLLPVVPGSRKRGKSRLSGLSHWKIFDNLRRSIVPPALVLILLLGWTMLASPWFWTLSVMGILLIPSLCAILLDLALKSKDITVKQHLAAWVVSAGRHLSHGLFALISLPYDAFYHIDAILRATWRVLISRRKLLEWNPSSETNRKSRTDIAGSYRQMWIAPVLALAVTGWLLPSAPENLVAAAPVLLLWLFFPAIVSLLSRPIIPARPQLSAGQLAYLGKLTRKTWAFFETYVGPADNWLPPDNVQEEPVAVVAHRTSPTNMGLALLANLSAHDFGYIPAGLLIERTDNQMRTMAGLERYRGHFYNWYGTQDLRPLNPLYVSTVDSGNLAGHLLTLRPGLLELIDRSILSPRVFPGLRDTFDILAGLLDENALRSLSGFRDDLESFCAVPPSTLPAARTALDRLTNAIDAFAENFNVDPDCDSAWWTVTLAGQCRDALFEIDYLAPWAQLPSDRIGHLPELAAIPTLRQLASYQFDLPPRLPEMAGLVQQASERAAERIQSLEHLAMQASEMAQMDYDFLYDESNHLLSIGYNVHERKRDASYYDLLASEARLGNFVGIAQGHLPQESWFALGRRLKNAGGRPTLTSWSGSMFEYLMPLLVMPNYEKTLLDQTYKSSVRRQIEYGAQRNVPWGVSESGYNMFDAQLNYQYRAFGVPGLGMKRGLGDDLVIAPYATVMALMVSPEEACANLQRLSGLGFEGRYGLYEAIDYTPSRVPRNKDHALVQSFMVHHQGMSFLSLAYLLLDQPMQRRFESDPLFQATMLLLHEKIPRAVAYQDDEAERDISRKTAVTASETPVRVLNSPGTALPEVNLLSNSRYHVMVSNGGGSFSRWKHYAVTRWREDATRDNWGTFCYIRDVGTGAFWSTAYQPTLKAPQSYEVIFSEGRAEFRRRDGDFETHTEIVVSPEDDIELRRSRISNRSRSRRVIEVTSYAEVVIAPPASDAAHPAFSNLFVQTEILHKRHAILCTRRPRSQEERPPFMFHQVSVHGAETTQVSFETDRMRFIGRGNSLQAPKAVLDSTPLSGSEGSVLDPIVAVKYQITLEPEQTVTVDVVTGMADTRDICLNLVNKYQDSHLTHRVLEMAWTHGQVILRQLNATDGDAQLYARLASSILYPNAALRADASTLIKNRRGQSGLWSYAISGDFPIVLLQIKDSANIDLVRQMVQAHAYWRLKGLAVDLVIWNEDQAGYRQLLQDQILGLITAGIEAHVIDRPGGIFVRPGDQIAPEDRILLESVARAIITDSRGTLAEQIGRAGIKELRVPRLVPVPNFRSPPVAAPALPRREDLLMFNGLGGFSQDGREYVIMTGRGQNTPAPWSNVLANPEFGTVISERGQSYTWSENAHAFRVTPWHNDPVGDPGGEAYYLRDEETGLFWSPAPGPCRSAMPYITRHGFGYSVFEHVENGIHSELWVYVAVDSPVKFSVLKIRNQSGRTRQLSATGYVEWVLGDLRAKTGMHVVTEVDLNTGALFARNFYNTEFSGRVAFFDTDEAVRTVTGDRREFIGRNGSMQHPAAMDRLRLSGRVGASLDPCAAIQVPLELADGQEREIVFKLGVCKKAAEAGNLVRNLRGSVAAHTAFDAVQALWEETLGKVKVETPDLSLNILANGWLMYQTIACRLWARSGYYQSGGAFGFRDQLQDAMALVHTRPELLRAQILLCAAHQFVEGDVQHWWHPPADRGVRTKCSDDYLWLPLAVCRYVTATGDRGILDEMVPFLEGRHLNQDEDSYYDMPVRSEQIASLYEHCIRAINRTGFGERGLPLIGSCDWNDGMDKVGEHGKGESVWLGFFLYDILLRFAGLARSHDDPGYAAHCEAEALSLRANIEKNAWDGGWYRRAYFDDGTPLGSAANEDCQIDSLSQSWAVLSGAADPERARVAMEAADKRLVRRDHALIQLLDPPFDKSPVNPGYIRGYVPGVRENGGQYTHAAIWTAMAFAKMGDRDRAYELLRMINPLNHGRTADEVALYKVEPYVVAADVYGVAPHTGRGGWTWYTGSSGWMYRLILESILGLTLEDGRLIFAPCLPPEWPGFRIEYRYRTAVYAITVSRDENAALESVTLDGNLQDGAFIPLTDDQQRHTVEILLIR